MINQTCPLSAIETPSVTAEGGFGMVLIFLAGFHLAAILREVRLSFGTRPECKEGIGCCSVSIVSGS